MSFPLVKAKGYLCLGSRGRILMLRVGASKPQTLNRELANSRLWGSGFVGLGTGLRLIKLLNLHP